MNRAYVRKMYFKVRDTEPKITAKQLKYNENKASLFFDSCGIFDEWKYAVNPVEMENLR